MDFGRFHRQELPERLAVGNGALAYDDVVAIGALGLRLRETGETFTYVPEAGSVVIVEGDEPARSVVEIDQESFDGLVADLDSVPGLLYSGRATGVRGNVLRFVEWEPGLRALYHGHPIFDVHHPADLRDLDGQPLDVTASFTLDAIESDPSVAAHFWRTAGYLVVRDVFSSDEIAAMVATTEKLAGEAVEGDKQSWWARTAGGTSVLCRVLEAGHEPAFATLALDERLRTVVARSDHELVANARVGDESVTILWKRPDIVEGLADLPWHRDCGMGGHASICPRVVATVCLTTGGPEAGELRVLPGSHRGSFHFIDGTDPAAPTGVPLATSAGDVSFHYSDLAHVSMPPTSPVGPHRISALVDFVPPDGHNHRGEGKYNDVLFDTEDGKVEHLRDKVGP